MPEYYTNEGEVELKYYFEPELITEMEVIIRSKVEARIGKGEATSKSKTVFHITNKVEKIDPQGNAEITSYYNSVKYFKDDVESTPLPEFPKEGSYTSSAMTPTGQLKSESVTSYLNLSSFLPPSTVHVFDTWKGLTVVNDPPAEIEVTYTLEDIEEDPQHGKVAKITYRSDRKKIKDEKGAVHEIFSFGTHYFALEGYLINADMNTIVDTKSPDADLVSELNIQIKLI